MLTELISAVKAGQELRDPASWKNRQNTTNAVAGILAGGAALLRLAGVDLHLTDEQLVAIAEVGAVILGAVNLFLTTATTKKIGLGE